MARRSLRPQLNQIRTWVRQGRTDAWIAHQLEVTTQQIAAFKRENELAPDEAEPQRRVDFDDEIDLRAEDDALIAAELEAAQRQREQEEAEAAKKAAARGRAEPPPRRDDEATRTRTARSRRAVAAAAAARRRKARAGPLEGTFDHGDEGYGLWLDPAVQDDPVYAEHWAGHRPVEITIEEDQIVIRRVEPTTTERVAQRSGLIERLLLPLDLVGIAPAAAATSRTPRARSARTRRRRPSARPTRAGRRDGRDRDVEAPVGARAVERPPARAS